MQSCKRDTVARTVLGAVVIVIVALGLFRYVARWQPTASGAVEDAQPATAVFVGSDACGACHSREMSAWRGSHHQRAMQVASAETVLGDFDKARFSQDSGTTTFFKRNHRYFVSTEGPDGLPAEFEIKYTFGVEPLQQYLIEQPGGRLQALSIAWDTRPREEGGMRWFQLYPGQSIRAGDRLHWTGIDQNWNFMCADCHSTGLRKRFDRTANTFDTRWAEINVGCEACHGPASRHIDWARAPTQDPTKGLSVMLDDRRGATWRTEAKSGNAVRNPSSHSRREINVCSPCHSRRNQFSDDYRAGDRFLDHFRPTLLDDSAYHTDGQQRDEVYTWGSFLQSRMYAKGVTCSDCHDPHSQQVKTPGNAVCAQCHLPARYDTATHHFHPPDSAGAQCAGCHMPPTVYMGVDGRHDHSFRIPRPAESVEHGVPNACNGCHANRSPQWAARTVRHWHGHDPQGFQDFAAAFTQWTQGDPQALAALLKLLSDDDTPAIVRASAIERMSAITTPESIKAIQAATQNSSELVREAAARGLYGYPPSDVAATLPKLLRDRERAVRMAAARSLAGAPERYLSPAQSADLEAALSEYVDAEEFNADRPEALVNLGALYADRGALAEAESVLKQALKIDPLFSPAAINLADIYRQRGRNGTAAAILTAARDKAPRDASLRHALGLALVRQRLLPDALIELHEAASLQPANTRYSYVYAVALHESGRTEAAIDVLEKAHRERPRDGELLRALADFEQARGNHAAAKRWREEIEGAQGKQVG